MATAFFKKALSSVMRAREPKTLDDLRLSTDTNTEKLLTRGEDEKVREQMYKDLIGVTRHNILDKDATLDIIFYWCHERNADDVEFMTQILCELIHDGSTTPVRILSFFDGIATKHIPKEVRVLMSKIEAQCVTVSDDDEDERAAKTHKGKHEATKKKKKPPPTPTSDDETYQVPLHKKPRKNDTKPPQKDPELLAIQNISNPIMRAHAMVNYSLKGQAESQAECSTSAQKDTKRYVGPKLSSHERIKMLDTDDESDHGPDTKPMPLVLYGHTGRGGGGKPAHEAASDWEPDWVSEDEEDSRALERVGTSKGWNPSTLINSSALRSKIFEYVHEATEEQRADIQLLKRKQAEDRQTLKKHGRTLRDSTSSMEAKLDRILELQQGGGGATPSVAARAGPPPPPPTLEDTSRDTEEEEKDPLQYKVKDFVFGKGFERDFANGEFQKCWALLRGARAGVPKYKEVLAAQEKTRPKGEVFQHWDNIKKLAETMLPDHAETGGSTTRTAGPGTASTAPVGKAPVGAAPTARKAGPGAPAGKSPSPSEAAPTITAPGAPAGKPSVPPRATTKTIPVADKEEIFVPGSDTTNAFEDNE